MRAIEFVSNAKDGIIKIPKEYQSQLGAKFRVIILQDDNNIKQKSNKKRSLKAVRITTKDIKFNRDEANER